MTKTIGNLDFKFDNQTKHYRGKVREMFTIGSSHIVSIATDRLSAFDVILPQRIPYKGQVLNQISKYFLENTKDVCPNWLIDTPHPYVSIGQLCSPIKIEMVIRGYLTGHSLREYKLGKRELCGENLPEGMKPHQKFDIPIITPTTKADIGEHDMDISLIDALKNKIVSQVEMDTIVNYTKELFVRGQKMAKERGLILVDTKYEFGVNNEGKILLIDEVHTPDSSRYFLESDYNTSMEKSEEPKQLSKEFVRQWLIQKGFEGKEGQKLPDIDAENTKKISEKYIDLYEKMTLLKFQKSDYKDIEKDIFSQTQEAIKSLKIVF